MIVPANAICYKTDAIKAHIKQFAHPQTWNIGDIIHLNIHRKQLTWDVFISLFHE